MVKGSNYLEALAETEIIVFDKTGTLTKGVFEVQEIHPKGISKEELLEWAAYAESYSSHPISKSLIKAYGQKLTGQITDVEEIAGQGVLATVEGQKVMVGNTKLMERMDIPYYKGEIIGTVVHVAIDNSYAGYIVIADEIKVDSGPGYSRT